MSRDVQRPHEGDGEFIPIGKLPAREQRLALFMGIQTQRAIRGIVRQAKADEDRKKDETTAEIIIRHLQALEAEGWREGFDGNRLVHSPNDRHAD